MTLSLPQTAAQDAARTTETPLLTFWRAVDAALAARGEQPATGGEINPYARPNKCDVAAADAVARLIADVRHDSRAWNDGAGRAAQAEVIRDRHREFLGSERYP